MSYQQKYLHEKEKYLNIKEGGSKRSFQSFRNLFDNNTLSADGKLFYNYPIPITKPKKVFSVKFGKDLKVIPENTFIECSNLSGTITIPENVETIGKCAFQGIYITSLDLSRASSLKEIGESAFSLNSKLSGTITIPEKVEIIGQFAFHRTLMTSLDFSKAVSLRKIGESAFSFNSKLSGTIIIPDNVEKIDKGAFVVTKISGLDLSTASSLREIGEDAFSNNELSGTITIPEKVEKIGKTAFYFTKITSLDLSKASSLKEIGENVFKLLSSIILPDNLDLINMDLLLRSNLLTNLKDLNIDKTAIDGKDVCEICFDNTKIIIFNCKHRSCFKCYTNITKCHICRTEINSKQFQKSSHKEGDDYYKNKYKS